MLAKSKKVKKTRVDVTLADVEKLASARHSKKTEQAHNTVRKNVFV